MKIVIVLIFLFFQLAFIKSFAKERDKNEGVNEFTFRGGLPNFFEKALQGDSIKVAYLGGSITAQDGWRVYSLEWFKQHFPKSKFIEINAAIGGTGSDFGVFRLNDHVLKFSPDLVFVEFAVNDDGSPAEKIVRSMEGIVRQIWKYNPTTDICFVYTIKYDFLELEQKGQLPASVQTMEKIANKYGISTINFGFEVAKQVSTGRLIFSNTSNELNGVKVFSPDGVHPYVETGHIIYQDVLRRSFEKMIPKNPEHTKKHSLGKPIAADYFANTQMIDFTKAKLSGKWEVMQVKDNPSFIRFDKYLHKYGKADQSGETMEVHFKGQAIGISDIMGPDACRVIVEIDGEVKDTISRFDRYCTYYRMNYFLMDHLENKDHKAVFRVLADPFDKSAILTKKEDIVNNPDKYKGYNWYVGKILIDGAINY